MFTLSKTIYLFSNTENDNILKCIRKNEKLTSGEIRVFIESKCDYVNPLIRAQEIFTHLKMNETNFRNAVLIYIAYKDHDFAIYADKGLYESTAQEFWNKQSKLLANGFHNKDYETSIINCINNIGKELNNYFPYQGDNKNEIPDEIIFGK